MPRDFPSRRALPACAAALLLSACAAPAPAPAPAPPPIQVIEIRAAPPAVIVPPAETTTPETHPLEMVVSYATRARSLQAPELAAEIQRLGETGYTPLRATQLALALGQTRTPANATRAQGLLQRVLADATEEAEALQPYARLLVAQLADQRKADEQTERQAQQLREAQRRIEQLNDRLEAVRAIERSLPGPAKPPAR